MVTCFEDMLEELDSLSPDELSNKIAEVKDSCVCITCPSYDGTGEINVGFCTIGKSDLITENKGCSCGDCPVTSILSLRWGGYCMHGAAKDIFKAETESMKGELLEEACQSDEPRAEEPPNFDIDETRFDQF